MMIRVNEREIAIEAKNNNGEKNRDEPKSDLEIQAIIEAGERQS